MIRTQVYLPKSLYQTITSVAKQEKKPAAQIIRELLETGLNQKKKPATIGQALLQLANVKAHAPKDTSMNIDEYLYTL
jgi:metal-responsive CopG/Arc/MetJ family transcriptional regulator